MTTPTIELLKVVLPDAIKILGPALITGIVAYYTIRIQYKSKLEEMSGNQSFKAREHLLDYYKMKIADASKAANELNYTLGSILGSATAINLTNDAASDQDFEIEDIASNVSMVDMYLELCDFEINTVLRDMEAINLSDMEEYHKLVTYLDVSKSLDASREFTQLKNNIMKLSEIYTFIARCGQLVLEAQIKHLFGSYVKE